MKKFLTIFVLMAGFGVITEVEGYTIPSCHYSINNSVFKNSKMSKEIWKDVVGYEGLYQVGDLGRVKSLERFVSNGRGTYVRPSKIMKTGIRSGYEIISFLRDGLKETCSVHRVVGFAFIQNDENKKTINHKNGIKTDNKVSNLEWATQSENLKHSFDVLGRKGSMSGVFGYENPKGKIVVQYNKNGDFVNEFGSIRDAGRITGIGRVGICKCCNEIAYYKTAGGFKWKFKDKI